MGLSQQMYLHAQVMREGKFVCQEFLLVSSAYLCAGLQSDLFSSGFPTKLLCPIELVSSKS
jgi:hypothetical protein